MPRYRQFLMLLSIHVFSTQGVDVAIYETHSGGEYDCTNIIQPTVTGITTIGIDHVRLLGTSIQDIAWHKAGIFKPGKPAFSSSQEPAAAVVLQNRAVEKNVLLQFVDIDPLLPDNTPVLNPYVQKINASLALALAKAFLEGPEKKCNITMQDVLNGIQQYSWLGRFQQIIDCNCQWYLDIAHNELSLEVATKWFTETSCSMRRYVIKLAINKANFYSDQERILIFSNKSDRDSFALLNAIAKALQYRNIKMQHVIFTTFKERQDGTTTIGMLIPPFHLTKAYSVLYFQNTYETVSLDLQERYANIWKSIDPLAKIWLEPTVESALQLAKRIGDQGNGMQTFVTGASRLIGLALCLLVPSISSSI
jgi:folylpolyglutamate synthase